MDRFISMRRYSSPRTGCSPTSLPTATLAGSPTLSYAQVNKPQTGYLLYWIQVVLKKYNHRFCPVEVVSLHHYKRQKRFETHLPPACLFAFGCSVRFRLCFHWVFARAYLEMMLRLSGPSLDTSLSSGVVIQQVGNRCCWKLPGFCLGGRGRETGWCSERGQLEDGVRLDEGRADLQLSALAHTDRIKAAEVQEHCSSNQGDQWTTAKLWALLIVFIAMFGTLLKEGGIIFDCWEYFFVNKCQLSWNPYTFFNSAFSNGCMGTAVQLY